jgi:hypothetical protein
VFCSVKYGNRVKNLKMKENIHKTYASSVCMYIYKICKSIVKYKSKQETVEETIGTGDSQMATNCVKIHKNVLSG